MSRDAQPIEYAPPEPRTRWRRRLIRAGIVITVALGVAAAVRYRAPVEEHVRRLYWFRQCMRYRPPPGTRLVEVDKDRIRALTQGRTDYVVHIFNNVLMHAAFIPRCWRELNNLGVPVRAHVTSDGGFVFLHERTSPGGKRRLVKVHFDMARLPLESCVAYAVIQPPTLLGLRPPAGSVLNPPPYLGGPMTMAQLQYGTPDPADRSHFTIPFEVHDRWDLQAPPKKYILDGYLLDDERIRFSTRPASP